MRDRPERHQVTHTHAQLRPTHTPVTWQQVDPDACAVICRQRASSDWRRTPRNTCTASIGNDPATGTWCFLRVPKTVKATAMMGSPMPEASSRHWPDLRSVVGVWWGCGGGVVGVRWGCGLLRDAQGCSGCNMARISNMKNDRARLLDRASGCNSFGKLAPAAARASCNDLIHFARREPR